MNLVYCPRCNKLFAKGFRDVCNACHLELEQEYERCIEYLRKNRGLNIQQLSDETEISIKQITRWVREGRISLKDAPNMSYPCEVCGTLIRESSMCESCRTRLQKDFRNAQASTAAAAAEPQEHRSFGAYQINKERD